MKGMALVTIPWICLYQNFAHILIFKVKVKLSRVSQVIPSKPFSWPCTYYFVTTFGFTLRDLSSVNSLTENACASRIGIDILFRIDGKLINHHWQHRRATTAKDNCWRAGPQCKLPSKQELSVYLLTHWLPIVPLARRPYPITYTFIYLFTYPLN